MVDFLVHMTMIVLALLLVLMLVLFVVDTVTHKLPKLFDINHRDQFGFWVALRYQIFGRSKIRSEKSGQWRAQILTPDEVRKILGAAGHHNGGGVQ